jgi:hypothetical protein
VPAAIPILADNVLILWLMFSLTALHMLSFIPFTLVAFTIDYYGHHT